MQGKRLATVIATILLVAVLAALVLPLCKDHAKLGLDLQGGVMVLLEAPEGTSQEDMDGAMMVIENRINGLGVSEPEVRQAGTNRISVEIAGLDDPEEAVRLIGTTAKLMFVRMDTGEVVLDGNNLKKASGYMNQETVDPNERYGVNLQFDAAGAQAFSEATTDLCNKYAYGDTNRSIAIVLDNQVLSMPSVKQPITGGECQISGSYTTMDEVDNMATLLNSGALPVDLQIIEKRTVGAQLGSDAISKSVRAAIIGLVVLALFMLLLYRLPGAIALVALTFYIVILAGCMVGLKMTITLSSIAGFLLSIGMGVDANIIIYERIKEELRAGKTLRVAVESGFKKAFSTILDSSVTTLIATIVLIVLGTSTIRGFAITLTIGILASMFTAITFTKFILKNLVAANIIKNTKLFGA